jgi:hypothetical protein
MRGSFLRVRWPLYVRALVIMRLFDSAANNRTVREAYPLRVLPCAVGGDAALKVREPPDFI